MGTRFFHSVTSFAILSLLASCSSELDLPRLNPGDDSPQIADGTLIDVPFSVHYSPLTRSSLSVGEDVVENVCIVAFGGGLMVTSVYTTPDSDISLQFVKGESYNIYALANVGALSIPSREEDFLAYACSIDDIDDLNGGFPMCWKLEGFTAGVLGHPVDIELERLVAKVRLSLMTPDMEGFRVTSVRLCQAASTIRPFAVGGSRALSGETLDGDYASAADLTTINNGGSICFYTFENCQGTLLEGNNDAWNKVPGNIGGKGDVCTYIEISCEHDGSSLLDGMVTYRMYLGADNCSNFDILRNKNYNLTLSATYAGMSRADISWKVDVDCEVSNAGNAGIQVGAHAEDDLYIGEVIVMGFNTSQAFVDYIGEEPNDCELVLVKNGVESGAAWFESISDGEYSASYDCIMHCVDEVSGAELYLKKDNHLICKLPLGSGEKINIQKPRAIFSSQSTCAGQVSQLTSVTPILNGGAEIVYAFLVDNQGYNLNLGSQYFDLSIFDDLNCNLWFIGNPEHSVIIDYCSQTKENLSGPNSACAKFGLELSVPIEEYNSSSSYIPHIWAQIYQSSNSLKYSIGSSKIAASDDLKGYFDIINPSISWDMDNEYVTIYNPSYIEIELELYEVGSAEDIKYNKSGYTAVTTSGYFIQDKSLYIHKIQKNCCRDYVFWTASDGSAVHKMSFGLDFPNSGDYSRQAPVWMVMQTIGGKSFEHDWDYNADLPSWADDNFPVFVHYQSYDEEQTTLHLGKSSSSRNTYEYISRYGYLTNEAVHTNNITIQDASDLYSRVSRPHAQITLSYSSNSIKAQVTSDPYGINYSTFITNGNVKGTCKHRNYSTLSYTTDNHTVNFPFIGFQGGTSSLIYYGNCGYGEHTQSYGTTGDAFSSSEIAEVFRALNLGCWHNSSEKAVANANNRVSAFTLPSSMNVEFAAVSVGRFVPVDLIVNISGQSAVINGTIYSSTNPGSYSSDSFYDNNLDGTPRDKKNIDSEVKVSTSNSVTSSSRAYTLTASAQDVGSITYYIR